MHNPHGSAQVSVILSLYNGETFLAATLDSALTQTYHDFELIVVDDGSTDHSGEVLARYRDPRLRILRQENTGPAGALQTGLRAATGKYVSFLDQDDLWETAYLAAHAGFLDQHPDIEATFSWFRMIDEQGRENGLHSHRYRGSIGFSALLADFVIGANSNLVFRRAAIDRAGGIDASLRYVFNVDLCLRVALLSPHPNIAAISRDLMSYRQHGTQLSRSHSQMRNEWLHMFEKIRSLSPGEMAAVEPFALANLNRYVARLLYQDGLYGDALRMLAAGFRKARLRFLADRRSWLIGCASVCGLLLPGDIHQWLERAFGYRR